MDSTILHIDFDSFFASVEQQENPSFRNKPLGVTATNGRTCIIASSREAKHFGIKTGTRTYEAQRICPTLILTPARFEYYFKISKKFLNIGKDFSPFLELFSIDEMFIDISTTKHLFGGTKHVIKAIKNRIAKEIGPFITVSVGISHNRLLAKLASGLNKPNGVMEVTKENIAEVYKKAQLTDVCGIGERLKLRLNMLGIYSLLQLKDTPMHILVAEFGKVQAQVLKSIGMGVDYSKVIPYTQTPSVKSVGRNYCLPKNEYDQQVILQNIYELCEEIAIKLRAFKKKARTVGLSLKGTRMEGGRKTCDQYMWLAEDLFFICAQLYDSWRWGEDPGLSMVRMISVWAENLEDDCNISISLLSQTTKKDKVWHAVDSINKRFGRYAVRNGFLLYADKLKTVPNGYCADRLERTQLANGSVC